jgi:hypothetical protein
MQKVIIDKLLLQLILIGSIILDILVLVIITNKIALVSAALTLACHLVLLLILNLNRQ